MQFQIVDSMKRNFAAADGGHFRRFVDAQVLIGCLPFHALWHVCDAGANPDSNAFRNREGRARGLDSER